MCNNFQTFVYLQQKLLAVFDVKPQCSRFDLSHSGQRGWSLTAPFQIAFLGQSLFLFSPVCGQSHSEASGPKVSRSIILILHCKQTGCILWRCVPDTEISSLSAVDKNMRLEMADTLIAESLLLFNRYKVQQTVKRSMAPVMLCIMQNPAVPWKNVVRFLEQNWTEPSRAVALVAVCGFELQ